MVSRNYLFAALTASLFIGPAFGGSNNYGNNGKGGYGSCDKGNKGGKWDNDHDKNDKCKDDDKGKGKDKCKDDDKGWGKGDCKDKDKGKDKCKGKGGHGGPGGDCDDDDEPEGDCNAPLSFCDPGCYTLGNKQTGVIAPPNYGLRLDGLFGDPTERFTFDFEAPSTGVEMCYDGNGNLTIKGIAYGGLDVGNYWAPNFQSYVNIDFTFANAACVGDDLLVLTANGGHGFGAVTWLATDETFFLTGKENNEGEVFLLDGKKGQEARGWVMMDNGFVGDFAMVVKANTNCPPMGDCDGDNVPDEEEADCDGNGVPDDCQPGDDCNQNGVPDYCDIANGAADQDNNGVPDSCEPGVEVFCTGEGSDGGSSVECPCGNVVVPGAQSGCANSTGGGASLTASGSTSVAAADLVLEVVGAPPGTIGVYFAGTLAAGGGDGVPFLSGIRCVDGPLLRINKVSDVVNGSASYPGVGEPSIVQIIGATAGSTSYIQFWYRDEFGPCGSSANMSNGLRVTWGN